MTYHIMLFYVEVKMYDIPYSALLCGGITGSYPSFSGTSSKSSSLSSSEIKRNSCITASSIFHLFSYFLDVMQEYVGF